MHEFISVRIVTLAELFSDTYHFRLPYFQRAYAWRTAEVGRLISNVAAAMNEEGSKKRYFLGKLMLAKRASDPETALVDGHQRVMTLTLVFAVLRDLEEDAAIKARLAGFIMGRNGPRLSPQEPSADLVMRLVQAPGGTTLAAEEDLSELSETERNILENRDFLHQELSGPDWPAERRRDLAGLLADRCGVIAAAVEEEDEAWHYLRLEEDTRVEFSDTDCAKWSLLSIFPAPDRAECQRIWERTEALLGAEDLHALLGHLRTIMWRERSERPVEVDLAKGLKLNATGRGLAFFKTELLPHAQRLALLRRRPALDGSQSIPETVLTLADQMSWINAHLWVPAALQWLAQLRPEDVTITFFKRLERLVWMMRIAGYDPTKQQNRIIQLLGEIERGLLPEAMRELEIPAAMRQQALANLRSPTFDSKHYAARVLRRISIALGQDPGPVHPQRLTIEHILPRGFNPKSGWRQHFPQRNAVQAHTHRLGNLTFLTAAENQSADTLDWVEKRPILARSKLVMANRLGATTEWTPATIAARTEDLIRILFSAWDLKV